MGVVNFAGPLLTRRTPVLTVVMLAQGSALVPLLAILIATGTPVPGPEFFMVGAGIGALTGMATIASFRAGQIGHIGVVSVMIAMSSVIPALAGIISGERPALNQWIGILLAAAGTGLVLTRGLQREGGAGGDQGVHLEATAVPVGAAAPAPAMGLNRATVKRVGGNWKLLGLFAAVGFGFFMLGFAKLSEESVFWAGAVSRSAMAAVAGLAMVVLRQPMFSPGRVRRQFIPLPALGLMMAASIMLYGYAATSMLTVASAIAAFSPVVTTGLSWVILREKLSPQQVAGLAVAVAGLLLISI